MTPAEFATYRKALGLTQAELASLLGVSLRTITAIEDGSSPKLRLYALALRGLWVEKAT